MNRIVESPYRNMWQRHHMVENFIDAHVWASWHDKGTETSARPPTRSTWTRPSPGPGTRCAQNAARLTYARLNDLCNIGSAGVDPFIDNALNEICNAIQKGLFDIGASSVPTLQTPDDPIFTTWTQFVADTIRQTYPAGQMHPSRMVRSGGYPTADDIAGAYSAFRLLLSLATEDDVRTADGAGRRPDLGAVLDQMCAGHHRRPGMIPPPPSPAGGGELQPGRAVECDQGRARLARAGRRRGAERAG